MRRPQSSPKRYLCRSVRSLGVVGLLTSPLRPLLPMSLAGVEEWEDGMGGAGAPGGVGARSAGLRVGRAGRAAVSAAVTSGGGRRRGRGWDGRSVGPEAHRAGLGVTPPERRGDEQARLGAVTRRPPGSDRHRVVESSSTPCDQARGPRNRPPLASMTWPVTQRAVSETRKGGISVAVSSVVDTPWVRRFPRVVREHRPNSGRYEPQYGQVCEARRRRRASPPGQLRPLTSGRLHRGFTGPIECSLPAVSWSSTPGLPAFAAARRCSPGMLRDLRSS